MNELEGRSGEKWGEGEGRGEREERGGKISEGVERGSESFFGNPAYHFYNSCTKKKKKQNKKKIDLFTRPSTLYGKRSIKFNLCMCVSANVSVCVCLSSDSCPIIDFLC